MELQADLWQPGKANEARGWLHAPRQSGLESSRPQGKNRVWASPARLSSKSQRVTIFSVARAAILALSRPPTPITTMSSFSFGDFDDLECDAKLQPTQNPVPDKTALCNISRRVRRPDMFISSGKEQTSNDRPRTWFRWRDAASTPPTGGCAPDSKRRSRGWGLWGAWTGRAAAGDQARTVSGNRRRSSARQAGSP